MTALAWTGPINAPWIETCKRHGHRLTKKQTARWVFGSSPGARRLVVPRLVRLGRWEGCPWPCERFLRFGLLKRFCQGTATLMTKLDMRFPH
jgi:hypothetical protein